MHSSTSKHGTNYNTTGCEFWNEVCSFYMTNNVIHNFVILCVIRNNIFFKYFIHRLWNLIQTSNAWSSAGCIVKEQRVNSTICLCTHLTVFGLDGQSLSQAVPQINTLTAQDIFNFFNWYKYTMMFIKAKNI